MQFRSPVDTLPERQVSSSQEYSKERKGRGMGMHTNLQCRNAPGSKSFVSVIKLVVFSCNNPEATIAIAFHGSQRTLEGVNQPPETHPSETAVSNSNRS